MIKHVQSKEHAMREQATKDSQKIDTLIRGAYPNFDGATKFLHTELQKINEELERDKSLQDFVKSL
jgi:hypothetical protein